VSIGEAGTVVAGFGQHAPALQSPICHDTLGGLVWDYRSYPGSSTLTVVAFGGSTLAGVEAP
jgi:hypothetical protein